jgi:autotransporter translocation and assembly factor TamB
MTAEKSTMTFKAMQPYMRPVGVAMVVCVVLLVAGWGVATIYLNSAAFRQFAIGKANAALPGGIDIADHQVSLLTGRLTLRKLRLTDRQNRPVAGFERLQLQLFWPALIRRSIHITQLHLSGLDLALELDANGGLNLSQAIAGEVPAKDTPRDERGRSGNSWQVRLDDLHLQNGRVSYHLPARNRRIEAESIALRGGVNLRNETLEAQLDIGRVSLRNGDDRQEIDGIALSASHQPRRAKPISLKLSVPGADLQCNGRVDLEPAVPALDLDFAFDVALDRLNPWLPNVPLLQGGAVGRGAVRGAMDDPQAKLHLEVHDARVDEVPFERLTVDVTLDERRITIADVQSHSAWGHLKLAGWIDLQSAFPENWRQSTGVPENLTYEVQVSGNDLLPERMPQEIVAWGGRWHVDGVASGKGMSIDSAAGSASLTVRAESFKPPAAAAARGGTAGVRLTWAGGRIELASLTAETEGLSLQAAGHIDVAEKRIDGSGRLDASQLSDLGALFGITLPSGQGALQLKWQGPWTHPEVQGNLLAHHLEISGWRLGRLLVEAELNRDGQVRFPRLMLENRGSLIEGRANVMLRGGDDNAWLSDPAVELALSIEHLEPQDFGELGPWRGRFDGRFKLDGTLKQPLAALEITDGSVTWQEFSGQLQAAVRWQDGNLNISTLEMSSGQSHVGINGAVRWRDPQSDLWSADPTVTARITGRDMRLEDWMPGLSGGLSAEALLEGRMSDLRGTYHLNGNNLDLKHQRLSAVDLAGRLSGRRLHLDKMVVAILPDQALKGSGWFGFDGKYSFTLGGDAIELRHIDALQRGYPMEGRLGVQLQGEGSLEQPNLTAAIEVAEPSINTRRWDDFHVDLALQDRSLRLEARLNFLLKAHGKLDSGDFDLQAHFEQSELTPYVALLAGDEWAGRMTGKVQAAGNWRHLDRIDADVAIGSATLNYRAISLVSVDKFHMRIADGVLDVPGGGVQIMSDGYMDLSASGKLSSDLSVRADGRLPVAALAPFTDALADARGAVTLQATAGGPLSALQWQADLTLDEIGFAVPALAQTLQDLNGRLRVSPRQIAIESLSGGLDGGRFALDARVELERYTPTRGEMTLQARKLPLQWPGMMDVVVNGDLKLSRASERALLAGRLDLVEGTYYKDVRLNLWSAVSQPKRAEAVSVTDAAAPWMNDVDLAVNVGYRNPFLVDNNLARLQIAPDLKIGGTLARPVLSGRAEVAEGEIIFRRKSFEVTTGVVDFINPYKVEPKLDVVSQVRIRHWLLSLSVSGTPDQLVFELSSDPPESDNDILSLILFGRTQAEIAGGDTAGSQTTTQMLATLVASTWGESLKKTTGVDILELDTGAVDDSEASDRIQVTVGKKLGRRLTIKYAVESTNGEMIQRAISEYRFVEQLLASGYQDSKGDYGGELLFRIEFR